MTDEQDELDPSAVKRKLTKRERFRGAVQRGVSKVKKYDDESTRDRNFTLNDDVKDFLAVRSPYSKPAAAQPLSSESTTTPTPNEDVENNFLHQTDPSDVLPHFPTPSRDPLPIPRIDVTRSPRFPQARDLLVENEEDEMVSAQRIKDDPRGPTRRKTRQYGLAVRFNDSPPIIIGEGGDEAEVPTMYLLQRRPRSTSNASVSEAHQQRGPSPSSQIPRKPIASQAQQISHQYISSQSLQSMEFDMTLIPGLGHQSMPIQPGSLVVPEPPPAGSRRLRMRAEEGKTLRESFHDASFGSNFD